MTWPPIDSSRPPRPIRIDSSTWRRGDAVQESGPASQICAAARRRQDLERDIRGVEPRNGSQTPAGACSWKGANSEEIRRKIAAFQAVAVSPSRSGDAG